MCICYLAYHVTFLNFKHANSAEGLSRTLVMVVYWYVYESLLILCPQGAKLFFSSSFKWHTAFVSASIDAVETSDLLDTLVSRRKEGEAQRLIERQQKDWDIWTSKKNAEDCKHYPRFVKRIFFSFRTLSVVLGADSRVGPMPKLGLRNIILIKSVSFIFLFCVLFKGSVLLSMNLKECDSKPVPQPFVLEYHLGSLTAAPLCPTIHTVHLELKGIELRGPMRFSALSSPANPAFASSQPPCPVCV